jgi:hypothetical protein
MTLPCVNSGIGISNLYFLMEQSNKHDHDALVRFVDMQNPDVPDYVENGRLFGISELGLDLWCSINAGICMVIDTDNGIKGKERYLKVIGVDLV